MKHGDTYTATDGSRWRLSYDFPPVPARCFDWSLTHDEYDGAPDAHDPRTFSAATPEAAIYQVEAYLWEEFLTDIEPEEVTP